MSERMTIWGKVLGGAAGLALGGPIGALIGVLTGHAADRYAQAQAGEGAGDATKNVSFTIGVIVLGAKMAKADGVVTRDEVDAFKLVFQIPSDEFRNVAKLFDRAKRETEGFEPYAAQLARMFRSTPHVLEDLLDALFHIAKADGVVHPGELAYLEGVAAIFGFDAHEFERISAGHVASGDRDPYVVLGLTRSASDDEVRTTYRNLIREYHPDLLIAQGLPQEFIDLANEKLATINDAYDQIKKHRGLN